MSHEVLRLTESLFSKPLLMTEEACKEVVHYLDKRNTSSIKDLTELASSDLDDFTQSNKRKISVDGVGMINIHGPISTYAMPLESFCNLISMETVVAQANEYANDDDIKVIALNVRSGGGLAHKAFELSTELRSIVENSGKKLVCYIDESACSAAYIFASVAEEVIINPTGKSGSIGVLIELQSNSKMLEDAGIERRFVTSSKGKIPYDEDGSFREEFIEDLQEEVSALYEDFVDHVAKYRGIDKQIIIDTDAKVYSAKKSKSLGLVDQIMTTKRFKEYLGELVTIAEASANQNPVLQVNNKAKEVKLMTEEVIAPEASTVDANAEMATKLAEMEAVLEANKAQLAEYQAKEVEDKKANLSASLESSGFLTECKEELVSFFMSTEIAEDHKSLMNTVIAAAGAKLDTQAEEAAAKLSAVEAEKNAEVEAANKLAEEAKTKAEQVKEEFATTTFSETSETKELNVQLSHEEKLAQAVAKEKAKRNA